MTPQERAARERKQKIFVVVGGLLLLALLAFQLPKLMGGSSAGEAAVLVESATDTPATGESISNDVLSPALDTSVVDDRGKLRSFTEFGRKDPFIPQVVTPGLSAAAAEATEKGGKGEEPGSKGFSTAAPSGTVTIVSVNGDRQTVAPGAKFPAADPMFVLVEEQPASKSVVIGVVGGAYTGGARTTKLRVGKPLVLVNTTTGARYRIVLVAVGSGEAPTTSAPSKP